MQSKRKQNRNRGKKAKRMNLSIIPNPRTHGYLVNDVEQFVDYESGSVSLTTSVQTALPLGPLVGILSSIPEMAQTSYQNGGLIWRLRIKVTRMEFRIRLIGAQSTALVAADIFNNVRVVLYESRDSYTATPTIPLVSIDDPLLTNDIRAIFYEKIYPLCSHAFNAADFNVPQVKVDMCSVPVNRVYDFFTLVAAGTSGWDTKTGNLLYSTVSDSAVTPNPTVITTIRTYYEILRIGSLQDGQ